MAEDRDDAGLALRIGGDIGGRQFALSLLYVVLATPKYEANAVVQVERRTPSVPGLTATASAQMPSSSDTGASTEIQLLTSRQVLGEAVVEFAREP